MSALLPLAATLAACSKQESAATATAPAAPPARRPLSVEAAAQARGFTVGAMMSANPVYVFFDAQCPHCGHLWEAAKPLLAKVKFVWVPVGLINPSSTAQGAALLAAADPMAAMNEHEASLLAKKGGLSAPGSVPPELEQAIKANTTLLGSFGAEGVPFIVAKNLKSGQVVSGEGAMPTDALAKLVGIDATP
jgi:thiol:disulfide interchange protein DsbG